MRSWDGEPKEKWTRVIKTVIKIVITILTELVTLFTIIIMTILKIMTNNVILIILTTR